MKEEETPERLFRHSSRPEWGLGRLVKEAGDRLTVAFEDGKERTLVASAKGLRELDKTDHSVRASVAEELEAFGTLCPRWVKHATVPRRSMFWRMGSGEWYVWMLNEWRIGWSDEQHIEHLRRYAPIPLVWTHGICDQLKLESAESDQTARDVLAGHGLLERHDDHVVRSFDQLGPVEAKTATAAENTKEHAAMATTVAMTVADPTWATKYCIRASQSAEDLVRASAIFALAHIARLHGALDQKLAQPAFESALQDEGRYVKAQAIAALHDVDYHAGWRV